MPRIVAANRRSPFRLQAAIPGGLATLPPEGETTNGYR